MPKRYSSRELVGLAGEPVAACGENVEAARRAAAEAIRINLEAYREAGQPAPEGQTISNHLENREFRDLLFAYLEIAAWLNPIRLKSRPSDFPVTNFENIASPLIHKGNRPLTPLIEGRFRMPAC